MKKARPVVIINWWYLDICLKGILREPMMNWVLTTWLQHSIKTIISFYSTIDGSHRSSNRYTLTVVFILRLMDDRKVWCLGLRCWRWIGQLAGWIWNLVICVQSDEPVVWCRGAGGTCGPKVAYLVNFASLMQVKSPLGFSDNRLKCTGSWKLFGNK